jgi:hypothetical protein
MPLVFPSRSDFLHRGVCGCDSCADDAAMNSRAVGARCHCSQIAMTYPPIGDCDKLLRQRNVIACVGADSGFPSRNVVTPDTYGDVPIVGNRDRTNG